jgi:uroporphyrinogen decarboxylase
MQRGITTSFLDALHCENKGMPPVWMMRQAGRYLPEYRKLRETYSLKELFFTPELAAQVTRLPIDLIGFDAAILFSDITVTALSLGLSLDFKEGPLIEPFVNPENHASLSRIDPQEVLSPIRQTIEILKQDLTVPLIGFCGGAFTVASYLIEKHNGQELPLTKKWLYRDPQSFQKLLDQITTVSIDYLQMQEKAGVDAIQIFDSWAHVLSQEHFQQFVLPSLKRLLESVRVPVILFMRGSCLRLNELASLKPSGISFDWQSELSEMRRKIPQNIAVQGNLDPDLLYAPLSEIRRTTKRLMESMKGDPGFIVNLGHGVKPDMPVAAVRCLVDAVKG